MPFSRRREVERAVGTNIFVAHDELKRIAAWSVLVVSVTLVVTASVAYVRSDNACGTRGAPVNTADSAHSMKAWIYCDYGAPERLALATIERPIPGDSDVLIRVRAASVNPLDWHYIRGTPYLMRLIAGLRRPKVIRLGVDYAGTVEGVGKHVTQFKPGDDVFGGRTGAFAEYVTVRADRAVALKPTNMTFEQAAAVGIAATTALQGLRDKAKIQPGQRVLINGASGGVGTFAVQIAKSLGAHVTGVQSTRNLELVRSIGADTVIDYTKSDYTTGVLRYDVIIDNVGNRAISDNRRILTPNGKYILIGGGGPDAGRWIGPVIAPVKTMVISWFVSQELATMLSEFNQQDLKTLADLMLSGKVTPVIDKRYPMTEVPAAVGYLETGRARGKVVITLE